MLCFSLFKSRRNRQRFLFRHSTLQTSEFFFCSCLFFPKTLQAVSLTFSALKLANSRNSLLISKADFEKSASYFSTSISAFSQTYVLRIQALFSPAETSFTALSFRSFNNEFIFRYMPSQKAITSYCLDQVILTLILIILQ